jgi:Zn-dependent protease
MLFAEPPPTQGDLHFVLFGFPVRIHPFFWLIAVLLGLGSREMIGVFVWVAAMFVSILVHELGHALVMRAGGLKPRIVLHGMGGLAIPDRPYSGRRAGTAWHILTSAAGPGAGFLLAGLIIVGLLLTRHAFSVEIELPYGPIVRPATLIGSPALTYFIYSLLFVCITWGLVNLLPIYPLDGGNIAREVLLRIDTRTGIRRSLMLSVAAASVIAAFSLARMLRSVDLAAGEGGGFSMPPGLLITLLFGYLAWSSYATLQAYTGRGPRRW